MKKLLLCMVLTGLALTAAAGGKKVRYQGELAGGIALEPKSTTPDKWYEITIRHGVRLFDYLFVGTGFSYIARVGTPIDREIPVFGAVGGCLPLSKSRVSLCASCDAGYAAAAAFCFPAAVSQPASRSRIYALCRIKKGGEEEGVKADKRGACKPPERCGPASLSFSRLTSSVRTQQYGIETARF